MKIQMPPSISLIIAVVLAAATLAPRAFGQEEGAADLAQELANPVADLISIPIQYNFDYNIGMFDDGYKHQTNIQPVIPFDWNEDWNLITRTIAPVIYQKDIFPGSGSQFGLGDINLNLFLSPKEPTAGGITWGAVRSSSFPPPPIPCWAARNGVPGEDLRI